MSILRAKKETKTKTTKVECAFFFYNCVGGKPQNYITTNSAAVVGRVKNHIAVENFQRSSSRCGRRNII